MTAVLAEPDVAEQARQAYRDSVAAGEPLTGVAIGAQCGRSDRWGRARIAEVRAELATEHSATPEPVAASERHERQEAEFPTLPPAPEHSAAAVPPAVAESVAEVPEWPAEPAEIERHTTAVTADGSLPQRRGARAVSWIAFAFGSAVSIAANVAEAADRHVFGADLAAAFWPIALLLAVEVLSRVTWRPGRGWWLARFGGVGMVAVVSAVMSYRHMANLLAVYGEDGLSAHLGPLAVDGLMVVAGFALLSMGPRVGNSSAHQ